ASHHGPRVPDMRRCFTDNRRHQHCQHQDRHSRFMPELPEVETIARGLDRLVKGDVIESVWLGSKPEPLKSAAAEIVATLESKKILGVKRMGKHIVFDMETV